MLKKFRRWLNYNPPGALSSKGWRLFKDEFKQKAPIRYWFTNEFYYSCILPIKWKYDKVTDWVRYRTYDRYHVVKTGKSPGYSDAREQILNVNFNILKDFVEIETAWRTRCFSGDLTFAERYIPLYRFFVDNRNPEVGLSHFKWAATLDDPSLPAHERSPAQAEAAREILVLYNWWVNERPNRKEAELPEYDDQGMGLMASLDEDFDRDAEDYKKFKDVMDDMRNLEDRWEDEDQEMLIRLMKIRQHLWT